MEEQVLVLEPNPEVAAPLLELLHRAGLETTWWTEGQPIPPATAENLGLAILDLHAPGLPGVELLRHLRELSEAPIIILSTRDDRAEKIRAFQLGADDFVLKPYLPDELLERVRARLRRPALKRAQSFSGGNLRLDYDARLVELNGAPVDLTRIELDLFAALARREGEAVSRRWLAENILHPERDGMERTIDVHISRLRKKLGSETIETVWGVGYRFSSRKIA